jgi:hypothetical protein
MINISWNYRIACRPVWEIWHLIHAHKIENKKCEGPSWRAWLTAYGDCLFGVPKSAGFALSNYADVTGKTFQGPVYRSRILHSADIVIVWVSEQTASFALHKID